MFRILASYESPRRFRGDCQFRSKSSANLTLCVPKTQFRPTRRPRLVDEQGKRIRIAIVELLQRTLSKRIESAPTPSLNANGDNDEARKGAGGKKPPVEGNKAND